MAPTAKLKVVVNAIKPLDQNICKWGAPASILEELVKNIIKERIVL